MKEPIDIIDLPGHGKASELFAYVSIDAQGKAGLCAGETLMGFVPFVGMTRIDLRKYEAAVEAMREQGYTIHLVQYRAVNVLEKQTQCDRHESNQF